MIEPIVDISRWQGDIDKQKFLDAGALGVIIRAGSINVNPYADFQFANNVEKFNGEIPCGYYWYFRPEFIALTQANYLGNLLKNAQVDLPVFADVESNNSFVSMGTFQNRLSEFLTILENSFGLEVGIYTRGEFWNTNLGNPSWAGNYKLWIARYNNSLDHPWGDGFYRPRPWSDWWLWQYSADGNGRGAEFGAESPDIDINRYNGTLEEFYADANWNQEKPPTKPWCGITQKIKGLCEKYLREYC
jgi:GH25 family lysozyme M1 (1,4-beta-N-acetylmuramidase)